MQSKFHVSAIKVYYHSPATFKQLTTVTSLLQRAIEDAVILQIYHCMRYLVVITFTKIALVNTPITVHDYTDITKIQIPNADQSCNLGLDVVLDDLVLIGCRKFAVLVMHARGCDWDESSAFTQLPLADETTRQYVHLEFALHRCTSEEVNILVQNNTSKVQFIESFELQENVYIYSGIVGAVLLFGLVRALLFFHMSILAAGNLHFTVFGKILKAPLCFFMLNPTCKY